MNIKAEFSPKHGVAPFHRRAIAQPFFFFAVYTLPPRFSENQVRVGGVLAYGIRPVQQVCKSTNHHAAASCVGLAYTARVPQYN